MLASPSCLETCATSPQTNATSSTGPHARAAHFAPFQSMAVADVDGRVSERCQKLCLAQLLRGLSRGTRSLNMEVQRHTLSSQCHELTLRPSSNSATRQLSSPAPALAIIAIFNDTGGMPRTIPTRFCCRVAGHKSRILRPCAAAPAPSSTRTRTRCPRTQHEASGRRPAHQLS